MNTENVFNPYLDLLQHILSLSPNYRLPRGPRVYAGLCTGSETPAERGMLSMATCMCQVVPGCTNGEVAKAAAPEPELTRSAAQGPRLLPLPPRGLPCLRCPVPARRRAREIPPYKQEHVAAVQSYQQSHASRPRQDVLRRWGSQSSYRYPTPLYQCVEGCVEGRYER